MILLLQNQQLPTPVVVRPGSLLLALMQNQSQRRTTVVPEPESEVGHGFAMVMPPRQVPCAFSSVTWSEGRVAFARVRSRGFAGQTDSALAAASQPSRVANFDFLTSSVLRFQGRTAPLFASETESIFRWSGRRVRDARFELETTSELLIKPR